jgi:hypothetical protein
MIKFLGGSRSPATAAAGSAVLILTALVGVILAAGSAASGSAAPAQATTNPVPFNAAPLSLPKPCVITKRRQSCSAPATKPAHAKQVKKHAAPPSALPVPTVVPTPTGP